MSHKAHLFSCALKRSSKLREMQSLETLFQWLSKVHKYQYTQTHTDFVFFFSLFILKNKQKKIKITKQKQTNNMKA